MTNELTKVQFDKFIELRDARNEIKRAIESIKSQYCGTWDDDEAMALRIEWRKLRKELHAAEDAIHEFYRSL